MKTFRQSQLSADRAMLLQNNYKKTFGDDKDVEALYARKPEAAGVAGRRRTVSSFGLPQRLTANEVERQSNDRELPIRLDEKQLAKLRNTYNQIVLRLAELKSSMEERAFDKAFRKDEKNFKLLTSWVLRFELDQETLPSNIARTEYEFAKVGKKIEKFEKKADQQSQTPANANKREAGNMPRDEAGIFEGSRVVDSRPAEVRVF